jgi:hypothetical protein
MRATPSPFDNNGRRLPGRRAWVKSAVLTVAAAMTLSSRGRSEVAGGTARDASNQPSDKATPAFGNKMVGFMLAHEQFTVPQLIELGIAAEQAGFDLLATSDHLQPWRMWHKVCLQRWPSRDEISRQSSGASPRRPDWRRTKLLKSG